MADQTDRNTLSDAILGRICNVSNLPKWMQVAALGQSMRPLANAIVDAILASTWLADHDRQVAAKTLRDAAAACRRMADQAEIDAGGKLDRWDAFTEAEDWMTTNADQIEGDDQ